jgi:hypothetical protein
MAAVLFPGLAGRISALAGDVGEALSALDEAIRLATATENRKYEAELHRLVGQAQLS